MTYKIVLTRRAVRDLDEAYRWCVERAPENAVRWYNGLIDAINSLGENPERCPLAAEARKLPGDIRQLLYGRRRNYRVLFSVREQAVVLLHIRHASRRKVDFENLF